MRKMIVPVIVTNLLTALVFFTINNMEAHNQPKETAGAMKSKCQHPTMSNLGKADKNYDLRFINAMIPHHEGAVKMAKDARQKAQNAEIKTMAQNIIDSQEKEISQLKAWRKAWYGQ
jgi:uncharacterized protein (DUF305 family)